MDVSRMGHELAMASEQGPHAAEGGEAPTPDHESGKAAMGQLIEALKSGNPEEAWHAFQGAMACAGCDMGDGAEEQGESDGEEAEPSEE
jgi:hypothetical protein